MIPILYLFTNLFLNARNHAPVQVAVWLEVLDKNARKFFFFLEQKLRKYNEPRASRQSPCRLIPIESQFPPSRPCDRSRGPRCFYYGKSSTQQAFILPSRNWYHNLLPLPCPQSPPSSLSLILSILHNFIHAGPLERFNIPR